MKPLSRIRPRARHLWLWPAAVPVLALYFAEGTVTGYPPTAVATFATGVLAAAATVVPRHRFTVTALAAAAASFALTVVTMQLTHRPETTFGVGEVCTLLLVTTRAVRQLPPLRAAAVAAPVLIAAGLAPLRLPEAEYGAGVQLAAPAIVLAAVPAVVLGLYLRLLDRVRERERRAMLQDQRLEYARELHDFVAHHVTAIVAQTKAVRFATTAGHAPPPAELDTMLARIEEAGSEAMESMRSTVSVLRDPAEVAEAHTADAAGRPDGGAEGSAADDGAGPVGGLAELRPLVAAFAKAGPPVELTLDPRLSGRAALPPHVAIAVHRLVREALTNVRKHAAEARRVTVTVRRAADAVGEVEVTVADDGRPRDTARRQRSRGGYGLLGLTERIEKLGGTLTAGPAPAGGWQVAARLPLAPAASGGTRPAIMGT